MNENRWPRRLIDFRMKSVLCSPRGASATSSSLNVNNGFLTLNLRTPAATC